MKKRILKGAIDVLVNNISASYEVIAARVGCSRRTLHRYYSTREDIYEDIFRSFVSETMDKIEELKQENLTDEELLKKLLFFDLDRGSSMQLVYRIWGEENYTKDTVRERFPEVHDGIEQVQRFYLNVFKKIREKSSSSNHLPDAYIECMYHHVVLGAYLSMREEGWKREDVQKMIWISMSEGLLGK